MTTPPDRSGNATSALEEWTGETRVGNYFISNYPPFSQWSREHIAYFEDALSEVHEGKPLGLYVHAPFCRQRCHYCYFRVYPNPGREVLDEYVSDLLSELQTYRGYPALDSRKLRSAYFGGGSPSYLDLRQIERLIRGIRSAVSWRDLEECTFECDPGTVDAHKLEMLRALGVTRISLGFQTLTEPVLRSIGRLQEPAAALAAFGQTRAAGFEDINIDLLAGLPGEDEDSWLDTVEAVAALGAECVTIYQMELPWNSKLHQRELHGRSPVLADWPTKRRWVDLAFRHLEGAGYTVASGYMVVRDPSVHRFVYTVETFWRGGDLVALGESSFGHLSGVHYQNADTADEYKCAVREGRLPVRRAHRMSWEEAFRREVILELKTGRVDRARLLDKFGADVESRFRKIWEELRDFGYVELDREGPRLTREGLLRVDGFLKLFYLPEHRSVRYT